MALSEHSVLSIVTGVACALAGCAERGGSAGPKMQSFSRTHESGCRVELRVERTRLAVKTTMRAVYVVTNATDKPVRLPEPDAGTVVWDLGDGRQIMAEPGRPDRWVELAPAGSLSHEVEVSWDLPGEFVLSATLRPRSSLRQFRPMTSVAVAVRVHKPGP